MKNNHFSRERLVEGVFIKELKNRFLCVVQIDGKEHLCYVPSSCRISNIVKLEGKGVLLKKVSSEQAKTEYSLFAFKWNNRYILINLSEANRVIERNIHNSSFEFLGERKKVFREKTIDGYKADFYIEDTHTIIEVKTLLSFDREAYYPSVISTRALKQLEKLEQLLDSGYSACYFIVTLNHKNDKIIIKPENRPFSVLLKTCITKGLVVKGYSVAIVNETPIIKKELKVVEP